VIVEPQHFKYLVLQRGGISNYADNFEAWKEQYERQLAADFDSILPVLPPVCRTVLDVGGGCSGIGAKINAHYGGHTTVAVLDGKACEAKVVKHARPYNNATITSHFLRVNGVVGQRFYAPEDEFDLTFDLIVSTQAWGFHFAPDEYLSRLEYQVHKGTVVILDVRTRRADWLEELDDAFGEHRILNKAEKYQRCAWTIR
jgi:hypothetical protein